MFHAVRSRLINWAIKAGRSFLHDHDGKDTQIKQLQSRVESQSKFIDEVATALDVPIGRDYVEQIQGIRSALEKARSDTSR